MTRGALPLAAALLAGACVSAPGPGPEPASVAAALPGTFYYAPNADPGTPLIALLPQGDAAFETLAERALTASPTLEAALARIEAARAEARLAGANRAPSIGVRGQAGVARTNPGQFGADLPPGVEFDTTRATFGAGLTASWDADLFGRLRARQRAAEARLDAAGAEAAAVRLALVAEIAGAVIDWRTLARREAELRSDLEAASELARLAGVREDAGLAPGFDRVRAESAAASSRSRIAALGRERAPIVERLVTLTALPAQDVASALARDPAPPEQPAPPTPLPSTLLAARPDIAAAAARLAATDAELASAAAARFPNLSLSAALGLLSFGLGDLFDDDAIVFDAGGSLTAPLFAFGRIEAGIDRAAANERAAFAEYRDAVFAALGEAEAAYLLIAATDAEAAAAREEARTAARAAELARFRNRAGLADFLTVLEARRAADASGERAAAAAGRAQRARVALWQALGGGAELGARPADPELSGQERPAIAE